MKDDFIVSFFTDVENVNKIGTLPEENAVPRSQISKKDKAA